MILKRWCVVLATVVLTGAATAADSPAFTLKCSEHLSPAQCLVPAKGRIVVHVCVSKRGKVDGVTVPVTSGYKELDSAAISLMKTGRFKPGTVKGKPVASCKDYAVVFE